MSAQIIKFPTAEERFFQNKKKELNSASAFNDFLIHEYIYTELLVDTKDLMPFYWEDPEC